MARARYVVQERRPGRTTWLDTGDPVAVQTVAMEKRRQLASRHPEHAYRILAWMPDRCRIVQTLH